MVKEVLRVFDETATKKQIYAITHRKTTEQIKNLPDGEVIVPVNFVQYIDENDKGEANTVLAIVTEDGRLLTSISATLQRDFLEMVDNFDLDFQCRKISGTTKAGREFVTVEMFERDFIPVPSV